MNSHAWAVSIAALMVSAALIGCPAKQSGGTDAAASAAPSSAPTAETTTPAAPSGSTPGKPMIMPTMPRLNLDAAAGLIDAAAQMMDAGATPSATASGSAAPTASIPDECNQYAVKQQACIAKMPAAMQGPATGALNAAKASWPAQAAANRAALQSTCKTLLQGASGC